MKIDTEENAVNRSDEDRSSDESKVRISSIKIKIIEKTFLFNNAIRESAFFSHIV